MWRYMYYESWSGELTHMALDGKQLCASKGEDDLVFECVCVCQTQEHEEEKAVDHILLKIRMKDSEKREKDRKRGS